MKNLFKLCTLYIGLQISVFDNVFAWSTDVVVSPYGPSAQHSLAAKQNGVLYAAMPGAGIVGPNIVTVYLSIDNGASWTISPVGGMPANGPVAKTKMVVTGLDSVYCLIQQNNQVYFFNVESGVLGQFNQTGVRDFDAAASASGNWIYIWIDEPSNNNIKRYGTVDGGLTWTGNTASVTSNGAHPRICYSNSRLILNYYGPVLSDTAASVIRAAFYDETAPGTLAAGTFQDLALANGTRRKQFQTAIVNGFAWFMYTEGDAMQVIKCRYTTNNGVNYQPEFTIAGNPAVNAYWFGSAPYSNTSGDGITFTYRADSVAPVTSAYEKLLFLSATTLAPSSFTPYASPLDTYNDTSLTFASEVIYPVVVNYNSGGAHENGIAWMGDSPQGPWLYFDRFLSTVGMEETITVHDILLYPSPAADQLQVRVNLPYDKQVSLSMYSMEGRQAYRFHPYYSASELKTGITLDVSGLAPGSYILVTESESGTSYSRFVKR